MLMRMWTAPLLAALALAEPSAAPAPAPAPAATPAPQPYGDQGQQPPPQGYQPPPPGYQPYGYPPPPPGYYYPPPPPQPQPPPPRIRGKGMMIAGWSIFGGTWLTGIAVGALIIDGDTPSAYRQGNPMFAPVVGPFIAAARAGEDGYSSASGTMAYVFLGLAQTAGLALGVAGTVLYARDKKAQRMTAMGLHLGRGAYLRAGPRHGGAMLDLTLRF